MLNLKHAVELVLNESFPRLGYFILRVSIVAYLVVDSIRQCHKYARMIAFTTQTLCETYVDAAFVNSVF